MENKIIKERLEQLRSLMEEKGIDYYYITTADYHNSEYADVFFKEREFMSGFTGSNGNLLIERERAGLWTDGRYFIQAETEIAGTGITLFKMAEPGVPTVKEYLEEKVQKGETLAFDGRTITASFGQELEKIMKENGGSLFYEEDLVDLIWKDRPPRKAEPVFALEETICGKTVEEKLSMVREKMEEKKADCLVLSKLDDIMWLFNLRGKDVACNPVALSYAVVTGRKSILFLQEKAVGEEIRTWEKNHPVEIKEYDEITAFLKEEKFRGKVLLDGANLSFTLYKVIADRNDILFGDNPTEGLKAAKNEVEMEQMRKVYLKDSLVVCRFMKWLKENIGRIPMSEVSAAKYMDDLRRETEGFLDLSFPTICGYKENAAMMHYQATEENHKVLEAEGMLLIDSGGQFLGGTTDVTRTYALGEVTEEMKTHFTAVVMGMLRLLNGKFLYGCSGRNLDILARGPLWDMGIDYKCGTGHGIGYILNVHEGPQNIRWKYPEGMKEAVLEEGMVLSNEPGVYIGGSHGIRIENIMVTKKAENNSDGQFMEFECLTFAPIDLDLIDPSIMEKRDLINLNEYHRQVYEKISPLMTEEEKKWLKNACREIG